MELALAMEHRLRTMGARETALAVVTDSATLLPWAPRAARLAFAGLLAQRGIPLRCGSRVTAVEAGALQLENGTRLLASWIVWATSASAHPWLAGSGLATDDRGFVLVDDALPPRTVVLEAVNVVECVAERRLDIERWLPPAPLSVAAGAELLLRK